MKQPYQITLDDELIVDNFAGGGGASTGIEMATNRPVDIAINHDPQAVAMHAINHPATKHYCESVWDVSPKEICRGRPVGLAWFSPDCKHFSKAKGKKPVDKNIRGLAWVTLRWASTVKPRIIMLENVEEFITWSPLRKMKDKDGNVMLDKDGKPLLEPCPLRRGVTFKSFVNALKRHGYHVEWRELRACDYGAPTIRKRLFLIARCDGQPIVWPKPTHGEKGTGLKPYLTAADCIDWSIPAPSIFDRKRPLAENTLKRIARGIQRYVVEDKSPFIIKTKNITLSSHISRMFGTSIGHDIRTPNQTATTKEKSALVTAFLTEHANASTQRNFDIGTPLRTQCAQVKGGHFALVSAHLIKHFGGATGAKITKPLPTITTRGTQTQLLTSHIMKMRGQNTGQKCNTPLHTISAGGTHHAEVRAFLIEYYGNSKTGADLKDPMHTVTVRDRFGLVTINGTQYAIVDIGMRMLTPAELYRAQGFPDDYIFDRIIENGTEKPLTKTAQIRMCGNSVCPPIAAALVDANYQSSWIATGKGHRNAP